MGDRAFVYIRDQQDYDAGVWLYTHWEGRYLPRDLQEALRRGAERTNAGPFLARIIFSVMIRSDPDGDANFAISSKPGSGDSDRVLVVKPGHTNLTVTAVSISSGGRDMTPYITWSFEEFLNLDPFMVWSIVDGVKDKAEVRRRQKKQQRSGSGPYRSSREAPRLTVGEDFDRRVTEQMVQELGEGWRPEEFSQQKSPGVENGLFFVWGRRPHEFKDCPYLAGVLDGSYPMGRGSTATAALADLRQAVQKNLELDLAGVRAEARRLGVEIE